MSDPAAAISAKGLNECRAAFDNRAMRPAFDHTCGRHLPVGDAKLYVEQVGDPAGEPLVLLHGGLGGLTDFAPLLEGLPPGLRCIGIDFRGHGRSALGTQALSYALYQRDVLQVLDALGVQR